MYLQMEFGIPSLGELAVIFLMWVGSPPSVGNSSEDNASWKIASVPVRIPPHRPHHQGESVVWYGMWDSIYIFLLFLHFVYLLLFIFNNFNLFLIKKKFLIILKENFFI